jgi:hypothetical protein
MQCCVILHKMIIKNKHWMGNEFVSNGTSATISSPSPTRSQSFSQIFSCINSIHSEETHYQLCNDLVKHLWNLQGSKESWFFFNFFLLLQTMSDALNRKINRYLFMIGVFSFYLSKLWLMRQIEKWKKMFHLWTIQFKKSKWERHESVLKLIEQFNLRKASEKDMQFY